MQPVDVDTFRIAVGETYDVIVEPREDRAYTIEAQSIDRRGFARATLAPRQGMAGPPPALRAPGPGRPPATGRRGMERPRTGPAPLDTPNMLQSQLEDTR